MLSSAIVVLDGASASENISFGDIDLAQLSVQQSLGSLIFTASEGATLAVFQQALRTVTYFTTSQM